MPALSIQTRRNRMILIVLEVTTMVLICRVLDDAVGHVRTPAQFTVKRWTLRRRSYVVLRKPYLELEAL